MFKSFNIFSNFSAKEKRLIFNGPSNNPGQNIDLPTDLPDPDSLRPIGSVDAARNTADKAVSSASNSMKRLIRKNASVDTPSTPAEMTHDLEAKDAESAITEIIDAQIKLKAMTPAQVAKFKKFMTEMRTRFLKDPNNPHRFEDYKNYIKGVEKRLRSISGWMDKNSPDYVAPPINADGSSNEPTIQKITMAQLDHYFGVNSTLDPTAIARAYVRRQNRPAVSLDTALANAKDSLGNNKTPKKYASATLMVTTQLTENIAKATNDPDFASKINSAFQKITAKLNKESGQAIRYQMATKLAQAYNNWFNNPTYRKMGKENLQLLLEDQLIKMADSLDYRNKNGKRWQGLSQTT